MGLSRGCCYFLIPESGLEFHLEREIMLGLINNLKELKVKNYLLSGFKMYFMSVICVPVLI